MDASLPTLAPAGAGGGLPLRRRTVAAVLILVLAPLVSGASAAAPAVTLASYDSPVESFDVQRLFERPPTPWSAGHRGIDLTAPVGTEVVAPKAGTVTFAGKVVDRGVITILHDDGLRSSLEPISASVVPGERVVGGERVGVVSDERSHCARTCVHWGVREGTEYIDPLDVLRGFGPVRLLPLHP